MNELSDIAFEVSSAPDVLFEFMTQVGVDYLTEEGTLPRARLDLAHDIAHGLLDTLGVPCRLVLTAELLESIAQREAAGQYTLERGANTVNARTMARPDGGYDIITGAEWLIELPDSSDETANARTRMLTHTTAHEAGHVWLMSTQAEVQTVLGKADLTATERNVAHGMAINLDEYRCEVTANRFARTASRIDDIEGQLTHFRSEMNLSYEDMQHDLRAGAVRAATACNELWKHLSYAIAELADEDDAAAGTPPAPTPENWDLIDHVWPALVTFHRLLPGADEECDPDRLVAALEVMSKAFVIWMKTIGFELIVDDDGSISCYWLREQF